MGGRLHLVSLGPGNAVHRTPAAQRALAESEVLIGYRGYLALVTPQAHQQVIPSELGEEAERAGQAVELALSGKTVALISGGDVGVYGMAGVALELLAEHGWKPGDNPEVGVLPGVTAANAAAALLGAPLTNDFACISLSDLHTPWVTIARRLEATAQADFVICLYNPSSERRRWQIEEAQRILLKHKSPDTPVGIVRNAYREGEWWVLTTLAKMREHAVNMFTIIVVGNSMTFVLGDRLVTRRRSHVR